MGLKGGVSFLALRSSQFIGEKNMWFLISVYKSETEYTLDTRATELLFNIFIANVFNSKTYIYI